MTTTTTLKKSDIEPFATQMYEEQEPAIRKDFIESLSARLVQSIQNGEQYLKDGKPLQTLEEHFKAIDDLKA